MKGTLLTAILTLLSLGVMAQETEEKNIDAKTGATEQVSKKDKLTNALSRLHIGGYGEAVMTRNFYSQSFNRYKKPEL